MMYDGPLRLVPGSTGCQPVVPGSLPGTSWLRAMVFSFGFENAGCRCAAGRLPAATGYQPVLPGTRILP